MAKLNREQLKNDWKCKIILNGITQMIENARLKGYDIIKILTTVLCHVIYYSCDERSQELFEKTAEIVKNSILDGLKEIEKLEKEEENGHKQTN